MGTTSSDGFKSADYAGRIQEIQQLVAHRFQLATTAILVFSAISGWLATFVLGFVAPALAVSDSRGDMAQFKGQLPPVMALASLLLLVILSVLYFKYFALLKTLRKYSSYVLVKNPDGWERDWREYRKHELTKDYPSKYSGYSRPTAWIFTVLSVLSLAYPFFLGRFFGPSFDDYGRYTWILLAFAVLWLACLLYLIWDTTTNQKKYISEDRLIKGWRTVLDEIKANPTAK